MASRLTKKCGKCVVAQRSAGCLFGCNRLERISRELDVLMHWPKPNSSDIQEQLKQCPEAFKAGELIENVLSGKLIEGGATQSSRGLAPAGAVLPPLV